MVAIKKKKLILDKPLHLPNAGSQPKNQLEEIENIGFAIWEWVISELPWFCKKEWTVWITYFSTSYFNTCGMKTACCIETKIRNADDFKCVCACICIFPRFSKFLSSIFKTPQQSWAPNLYQGLLWITWTKLLQS